MADVYTLQDKFKISYDAYEPSILEAMEMFDLYHNRQWSDANLYTLFDRGQPAETFNVIKMFARMLLGYFGTIANEMKVMPETPTDVYTAAVLNDVLDFTLRYSDFASENDKMKLDGMLGGLMVAYETLVPTGERDQFGRPIYDIRVEHVPMLEVVIDPMSAKEDYTDARHIHRFKWVAEEEAKELFGEEKLKLLDSYHNHLNIDAAAFSYKYGTEFNGYYKRYDNYLIVHSALKEGNDFYEYVWSGDQIAFKKKITHKKVHFPYRVRKIHPSNRTEYYGIFREVAETQKAINQALIKIQLMVNTQKAIVEETAVDDIAEFTKAFNRVNGVLPVKNLQGIRIENLTREVIDQYTVIDKALDRIQRLLSINDSFLGMAYASDSGRKVKLQQNASAVALHYLTSAIERFNKQIGWDVMYLVQQYFTASRVFRLSDGYEGDRWVEINKPLEIHTGRMNPDGSPQTRYVYEEVTDPGSGEPIKDENGAYIVAPIPTGGSEIAFTKANLEVHSVAYNDEDEKNQLMLETFLSGGMGEFLKATNPVGYARAASLTLRNTKTKYSPELAEIMDQTAQMIGNQMGQASQMQPQPSSPNQAKSRGLKLPANTNEGR